MVKLRILEIWESQNHTKYWLFKQLDLSYQNFNRMLNNETSSIRFENLDKLSIIDATNQSAYNNLIIYRNYT